MAQVNRSPSRVQKRRRHTIDWADCYATLRTRPTLLHFFGAEEIEKPQDRNSQPKVWPGKLLVALSYSDSAPRRGAALRWVRLPGDVDLLPLSFNMIQFVMST